MESLRTDLFGHSDVDTPVPTWLQVTRSENSDNVEMIAAVCRIISGAEDPVEAVSRWDSWSPGVRRSVALLIDKIYHEGWLDCVGPIIDLPWDGGFFFAPRGAGQTSLIRMLESKSGHGGYTRCSFRSGLAAYLSRRNHPGWRIGWMENDTPVASLHVGIFENGSAEAHLDFFNPLHTYGAPRREIVSLPGVGSFNYRLFKLHRRWEGTSQGIVTRTSANFYHLMRERVPLSF